VPSPHRGCGLSLVYVAVCLLWTLLVAFPVLNALFGELHSAGALAASAVLMSGGAAGVAELWRRLSGWTAGETWALRAPRIGWRGWLAAGLAALSLGVCGEALGTAWWELLSATFGWTLPLDALAAIAQALTEGPLAPRLAFLAVVIVVGPVAEELVFRGFLWRLLRGDARPALGIVGTSTLFAVWHLDPIQSVGVLPLAVFLAVLRWRSGSLIPVLVVHVVNNALAAAAILTGADAPATLPWLIAAGIGAAAAFALASPRPGMS
jgi:membrane protease YdiL (CAAX protease family)